MGCHGKWPSNNQLYYGYIVIWFTIRITSVVILMSGQQLFPLGAKQPQGLAVVDDIVSPDLVLPELAIQPCIPVLNAHKINKLVDATLAIITW